MEQPTDIAWTRELLLELIDLLGEPRQNHEDASSSQLALTLKTLVRKTKARLQAYVDQYGNKLNQQKRSDDVDKQNEETFRSEDREYQTMINVAATVKAEYYRNCLQALAGDNFADLELKPHYEQAYEMFKEQVETTGGEVLISYLREVIPSVGPVLMLMAKKAMEIDERNQKIHDLIQKIRSEQ